MDNVTTTTGIASRRLEADELTTNFGDLHPPLDAHEALVAADRCYFCHDAPCMDACPTEIDIPLFIRQISTKTPQAAASTIFAQNIFGGMCARVCPTEELCEEVCVREVAEGKPVEIGRLQRYATDTLIGEGKHPFIRAPQTGKRVAIVGAGPAGLSCAHKLASCGHDVQIFEARSKPGGLNEYGIAAYKATDDFAQREVDWLLSIGGISIEYNTPLGAGVSLSELQDRYDAVFLGMGLPGVNALRCEGEECAGVMDAVVFIEALRQADDLAEVPVGRNVVVIGGGMTAIDAAIQSKLLGAQDVALVYRRGKSAMGASNFEQNLATSHGVRIIYDAQPLRVAQKEGTLEITFARTRSENGALTQTGETFALPADQVFKAIGQKIDGAPEAVTLEGGKIATSETGRTSVEGVWAGGDCASGGDDLTVTAVAQGRDAAFDIHLALQA